MKQKVAVGLSGGVDSSVSAALLIEQGYEVTGVYLTCWSGPGCRSEEDRQDALDIALQLGIPFVHLDFQKEYKEKVYEYMIAEYQAGRTPNPDVVCNLEIKFGLFYDWALRQAQGKQAFDFVATGHYARIDRSRQPNLDVPCLAGRQVDLPPASPSLQRGEQAGSGSARQSWTWRLLRSVDEHKDQTYFLYQLRQEQLEHILFPIGHMVKSEVRAEAVKRKLLTATKPDSVGICFIGEQPMREFLRERIKEHEGEIRLTSDRQIVRSSDSKESDQAIKRSSEQTDSVVGKHKGVWFYTIGQKIAVDHNKIVGFDKTNLPHFFVIEKDVEQNILYVGTADMLDKTELTIGEVHWIGDKLVGVSEDLTVRIRHTGELVRVKKIQSSNFKVQIELEKPVRGVAPGQSVVFYQGPICLGGGIIV